MNPQALASHTVDLDLLPESPTVLDVGCRWFDFSQAILKERPQAKIIALDPANDVHMLKSRPFMRACTFVRAALVGTGHARQQFAHFSTGEGDFLTTQTYFPGWDKQPEFYEVECMSIGELMLQHSIKHWDLVKLDCEGSEFDILERWPGPIATQVSCEFHDWDKPVYRSETYYDGLWKKLPWYRIVQHEFTRQGNGIGHWDTLIVLR